MIAEFLTEAANAPVMRTESDWEEEAGLEVEPAVPLFTGFAIDDIEKADWYLGKLTTLADEEKRLAEQHAKRMETLRRTKLGLMRRFDAEFEHFCMLKLSEQKGATLSLPHGDVKVRKVAQSLSVIDKEEALSFIVGQEEDESLLGFAVETVELDSAGYLKYAKNALKTDGEVLPGVLVKPAHEKFDYEGRAEYIKACLKEAK